MLSPIFFIVDSVYLFLILFQAVKRKSALLSSIDNILSTLSMAVSPASSPKICFFPL